jgi:hypothetical protein
MTTHRSLSPATLSATPARTEQRDGWEVVLEFENQGGGPHLIDLSHRARWDVQDGNISEMAPWGVPVPATPGQCAMGNGVIINRMNRTQASVWHLEGERLEAPPDDPPYTNVTEATVFLALLGRDVFSIAEKLTALGFLGSTQSPPFLVQGPLLHVPSQIVCLSHEAERGGLLFTCSRGYGATMVEGIVQAGSEFGLRPAGEDRYADWIRERF